MNGRIALSISVISSLLGAFIILQYGDHEGALILLGFLGVPATFIAAGLGGSTYEFAFFYFLQYQLIALLIYWFWGKIRSVIFWAIPSIIITLMALMYFVIKF